MPTSCGRGVLGVLVLGACGCRPPTEVTIVITTNVACERVTDTGIVVGTSADVEQKHAGTVTSSCTNGRVGSIVLVPSKARDAAFVVKVVTGVGVSTEDCLANPKRPTDVQGERGCIVARRELGFIPQTPLTLPIVMHEACIAVQCAQDQTCVEGGHCVSDKIADPKQCADAGGCGETSLVMSSGSSSSGGTGGMGGTGGKGPTGPSSSSGMGGMMSSSGGANGGMGGIGGMMTSGAGMGGMMTSGPSSSGFAGMGGMMSSGLGGGMTTMMGAGGTGTGGSLSGTGGMLGAGGTGTGGSLSGTGGMLGAGGTGTGGSVSASSSSTSASSSSSTSTSASGGGKLMDAGVDAG
jgi:hypothetical protein